MVSASHAPEYYAVELASGECVEAPRTQLSHCNDEVTMSLNFPHCTCAACVWYARENGDSAAAAFKLPSETHET